MVGIIASMTMELCPFAQWTALKLLHLYLAVCPKQKVYLLRSIHGLSLLISHLSEVLLHRSCLELHR